MRILIVEDEETLAKSLKKALEKEGYAADYVIDGETAERRIKISHKDYDLVILDWMLPQKSGVEVAKAVRAEGITIPILMLTARVDTGDKVTALDAGADDYLIKPFSLDELIARVRAILRRPVQAIPMELKAHDLVLNTVTRKVTRGGKEVRLTVKEFSLLEYLLRHPNHVIDRNQVLDHLWGFDFDSFSNVVDVHIKNLRKKIGDNKRRIIETIRGVGYKVKVSPEG